MSTVLLLSLTLLTLLLCSDTNEDAESQEERTFAQVFLQNIQNASKKSIRHRTVPAYMKKIFKMQDRRSTFSKVSCVFSEACKSSGKRSLQFSFDLSGVKNFPEANIVQLHVFKRRSKQRNPREFYYVHLYQICSNNIYNASQESKRLISSRFVHNSRGEWLVFGVTSMLVNSEENGLATTKPNFLFEVKPVQDVRKSKPVSIGKSGRKQPFILVLFQTYPEQGPTAPEVEKLRMDNFPFGKLRFPRTSTLSDRPNDLCSRRQSLFINFHDLGMSNIIAPRGYEAYYCAGTCPIYSADQSLYSFLRNRQRLDSQKKIPAACCVPTQLESRMVMFYNTMGGIDVETFKNMAVSSCGCR